MTIQQLTYLLEVHKAGSFSVAAKNLFITQSAISNAVIGLEKEIGSPIFVRSKKGLVPTNRGLDVINNAKRICECIDQIASPKVSERKSVRIGCVGYPPACDAFVRLLDEFRGRDDIEFSFVDTRTGDYLEKLLHHELDIVLFRNITSYRMTRLENVQKHNLDYEILCVAPAVICIGPKHPLYNKTEINMRDLSKYRFLESSTGSITTLKTLGAYIPIHKENSMRIDGSNLRARLLHEGHAFKIRSLPGKTNPDDHLRYIPIKGLSYTVYYVTNPDLPRTPELDRFIALLKEEAEIDNNERAKYTALL